MIDIIEKCKNKDRRAQMQLYSIFYKRIYNSCFRVLRLQEDAEDAMQEAFLKVFDNLDSYTNQMPLEQWIVRIAINTAIDKLRKKNVQTMPFDDNMEVYIPIENNDIDWDTLTAKVDEIKKTIDQLPNTARLIANLYLIEGYDHEEIAKILDTKPGTVRVQYMRAKQQIANMLQQKQKNSV